jgi:hypothetical protein
MIRYWEQAPFDHEDYEPWNWQEYEDFKDEEAGTGAGDNYPEWYRFYDTYMATEYVMLLSDEKGMQETKYLNAWRDHAFRDLSATGHDKPMIFSDRETIEDFIKKVEPYAILDYYRLDCERSDRWEFMRRLENELEILKSEAEEVRIPEGRFPDAIFQAVHNLTVSKLKILLPEIHREHLERKAMGVSYGHEDNYRYELAREMKERLAEGKRLLGE